MLTRPKELSSGLASILREKGAEVLELPAIRTEAMPDPGPVRQAIQRLVGGGYDWFVFTSPSGVRIFFRELLKVSDLRALCCVKIAAIGQGTSRALLEIGLKADFIPSVADGETLGTELYRKCSPDARILIPRAASGNSELIHELERDGRISVLYRSIAGGKTEYHRVRVVRHHRGHVAPDVLVAADAVHIAHDDAGSLERRRRRIGLHGDEEESAARLDVHDDGSCRLEAEVEARRLAGFRKRNRNKR